jgi:hypothetical protein
MGYHALVQPDLTIDYIYIMTSHWDIAREPHMVYYMSKSRAIPGMYKLRYI